jgi:hypothetical protein
LLDSKKQWNTYSNILIEIGILVFIFAIAFYTKSIYEPPVTVLNGKIKIESPYQILETSVDNLSHVEIKIERYDKLGDYKYPFVYFKEPVKSYFHFFGINLWSVLNIGFRLDVVDENAREEIKINYIEKVAPK